MNNWIIVAQITAPFIATGIATWVNYELGNKRLRREVPMALQRLKSEAILTANKRVWSLIAFMTETENTNSIVTWTEKQKVKTFWFHPEKATNFMEQLRLIFYDEGHGVFLSRKGTDAISTYRNKIYSLLLVEDRSSDKFELKNPDLAKDLFRLAEDLRTEIRQAIELKERTLQLEGK
jgi:hypothetical protein